MRQSERSKAYRRQDPKGLFRTVTTALRPTDAKAGGGLHWGQDRILTVMEARRAQGFLDHEVIVGDVGSQWKVIGNSVSRAVALALGMSLRKAWLEIPSQPLRPESLRPLRPQSPRVVIQGRRPLQADAADSRDLISLDSEIEIETRERMTVRITPSNGQVPVTIETHEVQKTTIKTENASPARKTRMKPPHTKVASSSMNTRALPIRLSQTPSPRIPNFPKSKTTTIIELDDDGNVVGESSIPSGTTTPGTPGFAIYRESSEGGPSYQHQPQKVDKAFEGTYARMPGQQVNRGSVDDGSSNGRIKYSQEQRLMSIEDDGDDEDDVVFICSRPLKKV